MGESPVPRAPASQSTESIHHRPFRISPRHVKPASHHQCTRSVDASAAARQPHGFAPGNNFSLGRVSPEQSFDSVVKWESPPSIDRAVRGNGAYIPPNFDLSHEAKYPATPSRRMVDSWALALSSASTELLELRHGEASYRWYIRHRLPVDRLPRRNLADR